MGALGATAVAIAVGATAAVAIAGVAVVAVAVVAVVIEAAGVGIGTTTGSMVSASLRVLRVRRSGFDKAFSSAGVSATLTSFMSEDIFTVGLQKLNTPKSGADPGTSL